MAMTTKRNKEQPNKIMKKRFSITHFPKVKNINIIKNVLTRCDNLEERLERVEEKLEQKTQPSEVLVIEEVTKEEAKNRVIEQFKKNKITDIENLHKNTKIDILTLIDVLDELRKEGLIEDA